MFFEKARVLTPEEEGGLVRASINQPILDWTRQSHWSLALLYAYRKSGQHEEAKIIAMQIEDMVAERIAAIAKVSDLAAFKFLYKEAQYYAIEGGRNDALGKLKTWMNHDVGIFTYIKWDPFLKSLHGDPEFEAIVAEVESRLAAVRVQYHANKLTRLIEN